MQGSPWRFALSTMGLFCLALLITLPANPMDTPLLLIVLLVGLLVVWLVVRAIRLDNTNRRRMGDVAEGA